VSTAARHAGVRAPGSRIPRRVSGPSRRPTPAPAPRALRVIHGLARGRLLDRLLRSRAVIAVVGVLLTGIVFTQVSLLKLNASIGRAVETSSTLQRENAALQASVSRLSSGDRIQAAAQRLGMVMPSASQLRFVGVRADDPGAAIRNLRTPKSHPQLPPPLTTTSPLQSQTQGQTTPASGGTGTTTNSTATTSPTTSNTTTGTTQSGGTQPNGTQTTGTQTTGTTNTTTQGTGTTGQSPSGTQGTSTTGATAGGAAAPAAGTAGG
jgi:cell division protein FtsL